MTSEEKQRPMLVTAGTEGNRLISFHFPKFESRAHTLNENTVTKILFFGPFSKRIVLLKNIEAEI